MKLEVTKLLQENPKLKAKDIAKRLGRVKKSVNAFLHRNPGQFVKNEDFSWSLTYPPLIAKFRNGWVTSESFESTLRQSGSPLDHPGHVVIFKIPQNCKFMIEAEARLLALCNQLNEDNKTVEIDFNDCGTTLGYFDRNGFCELLDREVNILPERPKSSKAALYRGNSQTLVEFGSVDPTSENTELIKQLAHTFVQQSSSKYEMAAFTVFAELIGNVAEHSKSPSPGYAALQRYEGLKEHIQAIISDNGNGIAATLEDTLEANYPKLHKLRSKADFELLLVEQVMIEGEISCHGKGRGLGFKSSREQTVKFDADLSIRQKNFSIKLMYRKGKLKKTLRDTELCSIRGTHICFDFFVDLG